MTASFIQNQNFATTQTTPLSRLNALVMAIIHIPSLIAAAFGLFLSILAWPLLIVTLPTFFIGLSLYLKYWAMYQDNVTEEVAIRSWRQTYYINIILLIPAIWINVSIGLTVGWLIVGYIVTSIFLAQTALNDMLSKDIIR